MVAKPKSDKEAEELREALAKYEQERAEERQAEIEEAMKPLSDITNSKEFQKVRERLEEVQGKYEDYDNINVHLSHLPDFMKRLENAVTTVNTAPPPPVQTVPQPVDVTAPSSKDA
jgi:DNA repair exonuclease SbcCD ATPase subunit